MTLEKILVVGQTQESASALADFAAPLAANVEVVILGDARAEDCADAVSALVKELVPGALDGRKWVYRDSPVMAFSEEEA